jgi:hypothetical protein
MAKRSAALAAPETFDDISVKTSAEILDLDGVAARRELFLEHAAAASRVAVYEFLIPEGASAPAFGAPGQDRDARDQMHLLVAITGGAVAKLWGGLQVRMPLKAAGRFEAMAKSLIEAFLVAYRR